MKKTSMDVCKSGESTFPITAKLILDDGTLQEFHCPVNVSYVLHNINSVAGCFVCNSDDLDFDGVVSAMNDGEELQSGQLYFALPLSRLRRRLQPEDMAALAVKASSALGDCIGSCRNALEFSGENGAKATAGGSRRRRRCGGAPRRGKFAERLTAIPE
ncbi:uncharacterized protein LOC127242231 [Andrographis paniculata]|uniref:uncharacterized protein LOC127242231 n=1 Tax=Andrographis paniculata TaxID=175694 RepID=UPI0021E852F6|nr:uncharacterized protein LOC127242231 [Andrographis paniculata]